MLAKILKTYINPAIAHKKNVEEPFKAEKEYIKNAKKVFFLMGSGLR